MDAEKHRILIVNNDRGGAPLIDGVFQEACDFFDFVPVREVDAAVARLHNEEFDTVILDLCHAAGPDEEVLKNVLAHAGTTPVVALIDAQANRGGCAPFNSAPGIVC